MNDNEILQISIIDLLGLNNLPEERKRAMIERMEDTVQSRIAERVNDLLSKKQRKEFDKLLSRNAPQEEVNGFLTKNIGNVEVIAAEETIRFKREMVEEVKKVRDAL